jgi:hypothetical protein
MLEKAVQSERVQSGRMQVDAWTRGRVMRFISARPSFPTPPGLEFRTAQTSEPVTHTARRRARSSASIHIVIVMNLNEVPLFEPAQEMVRFHAYRSKRILSPNRV